MDVEPRGRTTMLMLAVALITGSLAVGIMEAPNMLDWYLQIYYPVYDGHPMTAGEQYLLDGTFINYSGDLRYAWIQTKYGNLKVALSPMRGRATYKVCGNLLGERVKYVVLVNGNMVQVTDLILMREIC